MKNLLPNILLSLLLTVLLSVDTQAQNATEKTSAYDLSEQTRLGGSRIYSVNETNVEGTPLLNEEFRNGRFLFTSDGQSEIVPINYDLERSLILYQVDGQTLILSNLNVRGFAFEPSEDENSSESVPERYTFQINNSNLELSKPTPIQVLYDQEGGTRLFAVHTVKLVRGNMQDPFTGLITHRYKSDTEYYLETPDKNLHELRRLRAKDIIKALGDDSERELNAFIDEHDLDEKSPKDLVQLLEFYDREIIASNQ